VEQRRTEVVADGLAFPSFPRWRGGWLWFSDVHDRQVCRMAKNGFVEVVVKVPGRPGGLGWLPDGTLEIVSMTDQRLLRLDNGRLAPVADLAPFVTSDCNDVAVHPVTGRAYVGNFGFDLEGGDPPAATTLVCVEPDGDAWVVVQDLHFPSGIVITADGRTAIVAESYAQRLSAYTINDDGSLADPRVWADLKPNVPLGLCLDASGAVWVSDPVNEGVMRVFEGSGPVEWIDVRRGAYACALGGEDGRTLFLCTSESSNPTKTVELRSGRIETVRVEVPGLGFDG
jgi:sugar lactone lactonase YvrE